MIQDSISPPGDLSALSVSASNMPLSFCTAPTTWCSENVFPPNGPRLVYVRPTSSWNPSAKRVTASCEPEVTSEALMISCAFPTA